MNRLDRLTAILIQLQSRKVVRAQEIAERFDISLRTVYRDIRSLEEGGVPIIGEAGVGYSLVEGYRLPPVMFTREEAMSFITAGKLVEGLTDAVNLRNYSNALYKVKAVLHSTEKDYLEHMDDRIEVLRVNRPVAQEVQLNPLQTILKAIAEKKVMRLSYFAYYRQEQTIRDIEPIGVFYLDNYWHLLAYCRTRQACRDFRFDRIHHIAATVETFEDVHVPLKTYLEDQYKDMKLQEVLMRIPRHAALHLGEQKYYLGFISEKEDGEDLLMNFLTFSLEGFARWYLSFADYAKIVSPDVLKVRVRVLHEAMTKNLL